MKQELVGIGEDWLVHEKRLSYYTFNERTLISYLSLNTVKCGKIAG